MSDKLKILTTIEAQAAYLARADRDTTDTYMLDSDVRRLAQLVEGLAQSVTQLQTRLDEGWAPLMQEKR